MIIDVRFADVVAMGCEACRPLGGAMVECATKNDGLDAILSEVKVLWQDVLRRRSKISKDDQRRVSSATEMIGCLGTFLE